MENMTAPEWVLDSIFYQIFPERFANGDPSNDPQGVQPWGTMPDRENFMGGDLQGILDHLDYLQDLGVNAIYTTPIFKAGTNHRYDTCDYLKIDPALGDEALLKKLVAEAHRRGMRVVLDAVFNHCGDGFAPFQDLMRNGPASQYANWFLPAGYPLEQDPPNYQTCGGAAYLPKLNTQNRAVQEYLLKVAAYWIEEAGIDGWRLDVPWKVSIEFWEEFRQVVRRANPQAYIVAEAWRDPTYWLAGNTCDAIMNYPLRDAILDYTVRNSMDAEDFAHTSYRLRHTYGTLAPYQLNLLDSHDTARILAICGGNLQRVILAATAQFTAMGAPMIYYGDEVGLDGENDPDCRRCMPWNEADWNPTIRDAYRKLCAARQAHPALRRGTLRDLLVYNGVYAFQRNEGSDSAVVVLNPRENRRDIRIRPEGKATRWVDLFSGRVFEAQNGELVWDVLPSESAWVLFPDAQGG